MYKIKRHGWFQYERFRYIGISGDVRTRFVFSRHFLHNFLPVFLPPSILLKSSEIECLVKEYLQKWTDHMKLH